jgi:hypothetical protein
MRQVKALLALGLAAILVPLTFRAGLAVPLAVTTGTPLFIPVLLQQMTATPSRTPTPTVTGPTPTLTRTPTPTRTATPTRTEPPPVIQIAFIDFWPGGNEAQYEYVRIENHGAGPTTLTNWSLCDAQNNCYVFPSFTLGAGAKVWVRTGTGVNDVDDLYWGRSDPVWDNGGDTATLRNAANVVMGTYAYGPPLWLWRSR